MSSEYVPAEQARDSRREVLRVHPVVSIQPFSLHSPPLIRRNALEQWSSQFRAHSKVVQAWLSYKQLVPHAEPLRFHIIVKFYRR